MGVRPASLPTIPADRERSLVALALILEGQRPPFEGRVQGRLSEAMWFDSAEGLLSAGMDYFGPVARKSARPVRGSSKADVADTTNVVWLDLDPATGADVSSETVLVGYAERHLEGLRALGMTPSVFIFSGRGSWAYWKLDRHVSQAEGEALMRRLYAQFRRDGSEHDIGRIARMPGSLNAKSGLTACVMDVSGGYWVPDELADLLPEVDSEINEPVGFDASLRPSGRLPTLALPDDLAAYVDERPTKSERVRRGIDGSGREQAIISRLVNGGFSDGQIAVYFDHHRLPRHEEEKSRSRGSNAWLARSIASARARLRSSPPIVSIGDGTYFDQEESHPTNDREIGWAGRRWAILTAMPEGLKKLELLAWVQEQHSIQRSQARRDLDWLKKHGHIEMTADEHDGRVRRVSRTQRGQERVRNRKALGPPLDFLKGLPRPDKPQAGEKKAHQLHAVPKPRREEATKPRRAMDAEEAKQRIEARRRQRSLINDAFRIHIPGNRWTYLQPLIPLEEWANVRLHEQLPVALDDQGLLVYQSFISPKDPALGGDSAHDPIEERTLLNGGWPARDRLIGFAAELAETDNGFEVTTREHDGLLRPNLGLVVQADSNFYTHMNTKSLRNGVVAVRKRGTKLNTRYEFMRAGDAIEINHQAFDLEHFIHDLADQTKTEKALAALPPGWHFRRDRV